MYNANKPDASELPSTKRLLQSTGIAAIVATGLLVVAVLPAEYGIDPTGAGSILGLTEMGRIKMSLAAEAEAGLAEPATGAVSPPSAATLEPGMPPATVPDAVGQAPTAAVPAPLPGPAKAVTSAWSDETTITLAPDESYEIKLVMEKGARAIYEWSTDGGKANFDTHGDGSGINYHGYGKGSAERAEGELTAAFSGNHGWFWRNRTDGDLTITLRTRGEYSDVKVIE